MYYPKKVEKLKIKGEWKNLNRTTQHREKTKNKWNSNRYEETIFGSLKTKTIYNFTSEIYYILNPRKKNGIQRHLDSISNSIFARFVFFTKRVLIVMFFMTHYSVGIFAKKFKFAESGALLPNANFCVLLTKHFFSRSFYWQKFANFYNVLC